MYNMYENQYYNTLSTSLMGHFGYACDGITNMVLENFLNVYMSRFNLSGTSDNFKNIYGNRNTWELFMFFAPAIAWFEMDDEVIALPCSTIAKYNSVGKPTNWNVFAINGKFSKELSDKNSVIMFNDQSMTIPYIHLRYIANYLKDFDLAIKQNLDLQSTPYVIEAYDEENKGTKTWLNMLNNFTSRIVIRKKRSTKQREEEYPPSQVLNTNVELKTKDFDNARTTFLYRGYTYLGIKNIDIEKRERLLTGEISGNDTIIQLNYTNALNARRSAIEQVNKMFGVNYSVEPLKLESLKPEIINNQGGLFPNDSKTNNGIKTD